MPEKNKHPILLYACLPILALYLFFTFVPATVYATTKPESEQTQPPLPSSEPTATAAPSPAGNNGGLQTENPPGFLEGTSPPQAPSKPASSGKDFTLYDTATKKVITVSAGDFLPAALACEMNLFAPREALKAQAVALYSFYRYKQQTGTKVQGADFSCDSENWLVYVPKEAMQSRWGEDFDEYYALLQEISTEVQNKVLTMGDNSPICAAYFAISAGSTESSQEIWQQPLAYLKAVASPGDCFADGYISRVTLSKEDFTAAASAAFPDETLSFSEDPENWLQIKEKSPSGYVKSALLAGKEISGKDLRTAFSLRSASFDLKVSEDTLTFTVYGWGHGVGMSQAGAIFLAQQGATYEDILSYYYPGTTLQTLA